MKVTRTATLLFLVLGGLLLPPLQHAPSATAQDNRPAAALAPRTMIINELAPIPTGGGHEWVELVSMGGGSAVYLPLIVRNYRPGAGSAARSAPASTGEASAPLAGGLDISGWQVSDEDGNAYTIPGALGPVPRGAYVLILFDGKGPGADDYDFGDGLATLHSPVALVDIFEDTAMEASVRGALGAAYAIGD